ncbi:TPA: DUF1329 domain-containing protein [Pseudomonas putida]|nr:DUF1329 domain-containing protein [Pseudomonas putida]
MTNKLKTLPLVLTVLASACLNAPLYAKDIDASRLGTSLNPMGGERGGNADGSIPAWDGGLKPGSLSASATGDYADPYASEKPLMVINGANAGQYEKLLTPGQMAMLKRFAATYQINVYPSHRSTHMPEAINAATRDNAGKVSLADSGYGMIGYNIGVPFPMPTEALEVIWNHQTRYIGSSVQREMASAMVEESGAYTPVTYQQKVHYRSGISDLAPDDNILAYSLIRALSPSRVAGEITMVHDPVNQVAAARDAWQYIPGQRRVRRAPTVAYDNSSRYSYGQLTSDGVGGFNGAPDRYDWKLIGKQERLIPYNSYKLASKSLKYADLLKKNNIDSQYVRYEKHRVWVVEATLKPTARHVYSKRRFYIDEDNWQIASSEMYDSRGELWRMYENYPMQLPDVDAPFPAMEATYDLISGRYTTNWMSNEYPQKAVFNQLATKEDYSPAALRRDGK